MKPRKMESKFMCALMVLMGVFSSASGWAQSSVEQDLAASVARARARLNGLNDIGPRSTECADKDAGEKVEDWVSAGYGNPVITPLSVNQPYSYTHGMEIDVVVVRGAGWTERYIREEYQKVANTYGKQCGIKITKLRLVEVDPPLDDKGTPIKQFDPGNRRVYSTKRFAENIPTGNSRLTNIHVAQLPSTPGSSSGLGGDLGASGPLLKFPPHSRALYKQWISARALSRDQMSNMGLGYSVSAHEIGHALLNCEHVSSEDNLMHALAMESDKLTEQQCSTIRANKALVQPLK